MNTKPKVSIVIPAYKADFFENCLKSAIEQDYENKEIVICDDSHEDTISNICKNYISIYPGVEIRYFKNTERMGEGQNFSRCIKESSGEYIKPLFDDDLLEKECCTKLVKLMKQHPSASLASCSRYILNSTGGKISNLNAYNYPFFGNVLLSGQDTIGFLKKNIINFIGEPSCIICRKEDLLKLLPEGIYSLDSTPIYWIGDMALYIKLLSFGDLAMTPEKLTHFRISTQQFSYLASQRVEDIRKNYQNFLEKVETLFPETRIDKLIHCKITKQDLDLEKLIGEKAQIKMRSEIYSFLGNLDFSIYIKKGEDTDEEKMATTLLSIKNQNYNKSVATHVDGAACYDYARQNPLGWTLLLCPGDWLPEYAFAALSQCINHQDEGNTSIIAYFDHCEVEKQGRGNPFHKPSYSPELLHSIPYVGRCIAVRNQWLTSNFSASQIGAHLSQVYAYALKAFSEGKEKVIHIPEILVHLDPENPHFFIDDENSWRDLYEVLSDHLKNEGRGLTTVPGPYCGTFHTVPPLLGKPLISIIIPTKDQLHFLSRCIESLLEKTNYDNYEIIIVDNESEKEETIHFLSGISQIEGLRVRIIEFKGNFNFSKMNNLAAREASGEYLLLLNNDTAIVQNDWLTNMMRYAMLDDVGIVGARLVYPEGTIQHAGVLIGLRGPAEHPCLGMQLDDPGYLFRAQVTQNFSAVTAACLLVSKEDYFSVGGLDENDFAVSYNDIDFCLKVHQTGKRIVWTPLATLVHEGSASQKASIEKISNENKIARFRKEQQSMYLKWGSYIADDPAYNPNLSLVERGYEVETNALLNFSSRKQQSFKERIVAFPADYTGCGQYRIIQPIEAMKNEGICEGGISAEIFTPNLALRSGAKTFVFQRPNTEFMLENLKSLSILKGIKKIFEIDDNLTQVPLKNDHYHSIPRDLRGKLLKAIGLCDRLVVSTEPLAEVFRHQSSDVRVVPNRLPTALWGSTPPQRRPFEARETSRNKPKVGWAGGISHRGDLEMVSSVIKELADEVDWIFLGMCPESLRPYVKEFHPGVPTLQYPQKLQALAREWDLAIAPVEDNPFNECKSNLKQLEIGWCGVPMICSDVTPYQSGLPVTLVRNRHKDWVSAIRERLASPETLHSEGLKLQHAVAQDWMLTGVHLENWFKAWSS